jgi:hypothetical protein
MWASQDVAQSASHAKLFRHPLGPFPGRFQHNRTRWGGSIQRRSAEAHTKHGA